MKKSSLKIILFIFTFSFMIGWWMVNIYNNLVKLNENVKTQWSQVENVYQRRSDLIPNLVNTVKGASYFEKDTLNKITQSRAKMGTVQVDPDKLNQNQIDHFQKAQEDFRHSIHQFILTVENYPDIKSTKNFSELQNQLEGTENRINVERNRFNDQVNNFNTYRNQFPKIMIANFFKEFQEKGYFKSQISSEKSPIVDFAY
ncbi:LemA family protein [Blattabacterium cuenoti]|uniref:LemA family protein n=1 Tax=Blattabacterium cuenoti TaxID=1653831 RepID=UPI00163CF7C6|nr:LemA family protein [Blattabacterium cuenoti]